VLRQLTMAVRKNEPTRKNSAEKNMIIRAKFLNLSLS